MKKRESEMEEQRVKQQTQAKIAQDAHNAEMARMKRDQEQRDL